MSKPYLLKMFAAVLFSVTATPVFAQQPYTPTALTADDYARAENFLSYKIAPLVDRAGIRPVWLTGERFYYRNLLANGSEFILINPANGSRQPAFDQAKLAAALSTAAGANYNAARLPFTDFTFSPDGQTISFSVKDRRWKCDVTGSQCAPDVMTGSGGQNRSFNEVVSPDGKRAAFIRDWNLWARDIATGKETRLTTDGVKDYGYATDNAGWKQSDRAILLWSPDSKKIATFQQDQRRSGDMYLVTTNVGHPTLKSWKYPLPGDKDVTMIERVIIEVDNAKVIRLQIPPDQHRSTLCDDISCSGSFDDNEWSAEGSKLAFVSTSRDHKREQFRIADAATGAVREVFEEVSPTQYESGWSNINWHYLPASNEIIWFSERDGWGHLYLYDLTTGKL
ncbi:MAG: DPP IV N-terminal domain-containing protein, partial [Pyrinomonadaceae bacterium]